MPRGGKKAGRRPDRGKSDCITCSPTKDDQMKKKYEQKSNKTQVEIINSDDSGDRSDNSITSITTLPRSPTPSPSETPKNKKKTERRHAKLTEAQQDTMFEWLEQTPAIYDTNHEDYKRRIQLFSEQAVKMGKGIDGETLELWFKSYRTIISKCKTKTMKSRSNWKPTVHGIPNEKRLWETMCWLVPFIRPPRRHSIKSVSN